MDICVQLELNLEDKNSQEMKLFILQKQIDTMNESMGKVRRKLFMELGAMKKLCLTLVTENEVMKQQLREVRNEKIEWLYASNDTLFSEKQASIEQIGDNFYPNAG